MAETINAPDLSGAIGTLLSNPTALSNIMNIIGGIRQTPQQKENEQQEATQDDVQAVSKNEDISAAGMNLAAISSLFNSKKEEKQSDNFFKNDSLKKRRCLLEAIRPYLSPARCETLNVLLRILDILTLLSIKK